MYNFSITENGRGKAVRVIIVLHPILTIVQTGKLQPQETGMPSKLLYSKKQKKQGDVVSIYFAHRNPGGRKSIYGEMMNSKEKH